ncbi:sensor domain-containing diguanylate cyclase [Alteromonas ponticola]|uniref:diguanylate cyclase n=1 Tax=Alteromonas ponticola TaxID=2720613 RepID=A0ABX1R790_9ALTE|nr:diguanylate cyclase [Alteromonas ponticola]NMH60982.1 GGDEF domain-containing protein [Alteromonas ponticola]
MNHKNSARLLTFLLALLVSFFGYPQPIIDLTDTPELTAGEYTRYLQENNDEKLTLAQAIAAFNSSEVRLGKHQSISLGISVAPVWLKTRLLNSTTNDENYRISVETPWLDVIEAWIVYQGRVIQQVSGGDAVAFEQRPMQYRYFAFEAELPKGESQLYLRVESVGPMAIPLRIATTELAVKRDISSSYQYGFLYGIMVALALYNLILFFSVRLPEYGLYALYLIGFVINSLSYTGQLHTWITPDFGPYFQDWLDIFLMITYSIAGLHFARKLLQTKQYAPILDRATIVVTLVIPAGMVIGFIFNQLTFALFLAFLLNTTFAVLFILLGLQALKHRIAAARLFLICSVTAATCICISTAAVAGFVPYNDVTFKLIEVGMAFEAICLAFLLAQRFRSAEADKQMAEKTARLDSLTGLNNRRGFAHAAQPIWFQEIRNGRDVSVVLIDIDHFKRINDGFGHSKGDEVLKAVAAVLKRGARRSDIIARWGGEEFLILLPETSEAQATQHAERLRQQIEKIELTSPGGAIKFTASFGVCGTIDGMFSKTKLRDDDLETIINVADEALYQVKASGRNQVKAATQQHVRQSRSKVKV